MSVVRRYRKGDSERVADLVAHGEPILAVDPGAHGMALMFDPANLWPQGVPPRPRALVPLWGFEGLGMLADVVRRELAAFGNPRLLVVIEESYGGGRKNIATDLALARFAGAVLGAVDVASTDSNRWSAAFVMPASWLAAVGRARGKREDRKAMARAHAIARLGLPAVETSAKLAPHREAYCDAYGVATWWGKLSRTPLAIRQPEEGRTA